MCPGGESLPGGGAPLSLFTSSPHTQRERRVATLLRRPQAGNNSRVPQWDRGQGDAAASAPEPAPSSEEQSMADPGAWLTPGAWLAPERG